MSCNWVTRKLDDLISIKHGFAFKGEFFTDKETYNYLVTPGNFAIGGGFKGDKFKYYNGPVPDNYILEVGALVVTMTDLSKQADTLGYSALIPEIEGHRILHNQRVGLVENISNEIDKEFLYFLLRSKEYRHYVVSGATGTTVKHTSPTKILSYEFQLPPLDIQREIAKNLIALEKKITVNFDTNEILEEMAQAIFKSWFVNFDPVKAKMNGGQPEGMDAATASLFPEKLVESELGLIPEGWDIGSIEDVTSKVFSGGTPATKNEDFWGGDLPWFSSGETRNNFIIGTEKYITEAGVRGSSTKASAYGDVLIASAGQGHTRGQTSFNSIDCYINQSVVALRAAGNVSAYWLYYNLERRYDEMRSVSDSHSSRGSLTTKLLKGMPAIIPSKEIVIAFDRIVESLVRKQVANSNQNEDLSALRDTLLPKLLSGEIELGNTEKLVEVS
ncbi:restriction endonuclease subunit S [Vibrio sp. TH_r3]|uniref:restriction endonuclease subunit S n=1 Tax=Vibrio sp. TH_r3 TaxID=3082084 RepID=UPI002953E413|nr:restriction endonuclease subunit S [Vibrio sp. TH_r3]MDV7106250.1 restriction endonuclease subunit S [Vibrio sp. TH_r3]